MRYLVLIVFVSLMVFAAPRAGVADEALDWYLKGNKLSQAGEFDQAVDAYFSAIRINPKAVGPYYNLGLAFKHLKQYDHAAGAFEQASQLEPDNMNVRLRLGNIYNLMEKWDKAIEHLNLVVHREQGNAEAHGNLGWAYLNYTQGPRFKMLVITNLEQAVALFEQQNMKGAADATRTTLKDARKRFGYELQ